MEVEPLLVLLLEEDVEEFAAVPPVLELLRTRQDEDAEEQGAARRCRCKTTDPPLVPVAGSRREAATQGGPMLPWPASRTG